MAEVIQKSIKSSTTRPDLCQECEKSKPKAKVTRKGVELWVCKECAMKGITYFEAHGTLKRGSAHYDKQALNSMLAAQEGLNDLAGADEIDSLDLQLFKALFQQVDEDNSGGIDADEMLKLVRKLDPNQTAATSKAEAQKLIDQVDDDKDGVLKFNEFLKLVLMVRQGRGPPALKNILAAANNDELKNQLATTKGSDSDVDSLLASTVAKERPQKSRTMSTPGQLQREARTLLASQVASIPEGGGGTGDLDFNDLDSMADDQKAAAEVQSLETDPEWTFFMANL